MLERWAWPIAQGGTQGGTPGGIGPGELIVKACSVSCLCFYICKVRWCLAVRVEDIVNAQGGFWHHWHHHSCLKNMVLRGQDLCPTCYGLQDLGELGHVQVQVELLTRQGVEGGV